MSNTYRKSIFVLKGCVKMAEENEKLQDKTDTTTIWMGWIGIISGIISFFFAPLLFGCLAVVLGIFSIFSQGNYVGWSAIGLGITGTIASLWFTKIFTSFKNTSVENLFQH
jgi:uncharacterized protein YqhQ